MVEGPIEKVANKEIAIAVQAIKSRKEAGPFEVCVEMISASREKGINVIVEFCQSFLDVRKLNAG